MAAARPSRGRILVVDDEPEVRRALRLSLEDAGYEVREASNGAFALAAARIWQPELVVVDLLMPTMNGWQFVEAYARLQGERASVVAITAAGPSAVRSARELRAVAAVLAKPFDVDELLDVVEQHMAGAAWRLGAGGAPA
ncbi:MAG TPA: response regulator [Chloroflexota bacterium]|nr:response regulator [Chloroflexota bacterium]